NILPKDQFPLVLCCDTNISVLRNDESNAVGIVRAISHHRAMPSSEMRVISSVELATFICDEDRLRRFVVRDLDPKSAQFKGRRHQNKTVDPGQKGREPYCTVDFLLSCFHFVFQNSYFYSKRIGNGLSQSFSIADASV